MHESKVVKWVYYHSD